MTVARCPVWRPVDREFTPSSCTRHFSSVSRPSRPAHVVCQTMEAGTVDNHKQQRVLLETAADLCDAFYHVKDTPEASTSACCLRLNNCCSGKTTCLIAQLLASDGSEQFLQLYRNKAQTSCAEGFLQRDQSLITALKRLPSGCGPGAILNLFLTQQPCHYSSSNDEGSCTDNLTRWFWDVLQPLGVRGIHIKAAYPYRSHWDERFMSEDDLAGLGRRRWAGGRGGGKGGRGGGGSKGGSWGGRNGGKGWGQSKGCSDFRPPSARGPESDRSECIARARRLLANAREGTRQLVSGTGGVTLDAFSEDDWKFVLGVCATDLQRQHDAGDAPFTPEVKAKRARIDAFTKAVFDAHRPTREPAAQREDAGSKESTSTEANGQSSFGNGAAISSSSGREETPASGASRTLEELT